MLELLDDVQPWINFALAFTAGVVGLWAAFQQHRLKRKGLTHTFIGSACLVLLAPGLILTDLPPDGQLVRAFILRVLFMLLYLSWGIKALYHLREWRRTIRRVVESGQ